MRRLLGPKNPIDVEALRGKSTEDPISNVFNIQPITDCLASPDQHTSQTKPYDWEQEDIGLNQETTAEPSMDLHPEEKPAYSPNIRNISAIAISQTINQNNPAIPRRQTNTGVLSTPEMFLGVNKLQNLE